MPEKRTMKEARAAKRAGKSPTTQAGAFVHEEIEHVREGKHGVRNTKQAIAIGLAKALSRHAKSAARQRPAAARKRAAQKAARTRRRHASA